MPFIELTSKSTFFSKDSSFSSRIANTRSAPAKAFIKEEYNWAISLIGRVNCLVVDRNIITIAIVKGSFSNVLPIPFIIKRAPHKVTIK